MGELRRVENRFSLSLDARKLAVREGVDRPLLRTIAKAQEAYARRHDHTELIDDLTLRNTSSRGVIYTLGHGAVLQGLGRYSVSNENILDAEYRFEHEMYQPDIENEIAFMRASLADLRDGLQPAARRYEGPVWTRVALGQAATRRACEQVGYEQLDEQNNHAIMVRRL